jgi:hypothetical protein
MSGNSISLKLAAVLLAGLAAFIAAALPAGLAPVRLASFNAPSSEIHQQDHYTLGRPQDSEWRPARDWGSSTPADEEMPGAAGIVIAAFALQISSGAGAYELELRDRPGFLNQRTHDPRAPPVSRTSV